MPGPQVVVVRWVIEPQVRLAARGVLDHVVGVRVYRFAVDVQPDVVRHALVGGHEIVLGLAEAAAVERGRVLVDLVRVGSSTYRL